MSHEICEECGIFAVAGHPKAAELCYYGLYALQHRGQESAGIAVYRKSGIYTRKGMGLVSDVFSKESIGDLGGEMAIGHVRYSTTGESRLENAQPITVKMWRGEMSLAHNGNLVNARRLRKTLESQGSIFQTTSDTEVIPHLVAKSLAGDTLDALRFALSQVKGAYALVVLTPEGIFGVKDPNGFRPLCLGEVEGAYILSSESCAIDAVGGRFVRELEPGEIVKIGYLPASLESVRAFPPGRASLCVFEFIYFARPDSDIYGLNVHAARKALGRRLAIKAPCDADLVTGVPDSSLSAASGYAEEAGMPYEMGLVKNRYIGRTFIAPEQSMREAGVRIKLNPLRRLVDGKRVVLVDDSIVRGTTSRHIIGLLRAAGAREVHVRISSPPYRYPCYYGIDTSSRGELIASAMDVDEIRKTIGADSLAFLEVADLEEVLGKRVGSLCYACFTGDYPVPPARDFDGDCG